MEKRIAFCTLGCKLNFAETSALSRRFVEMGFRRVPFGVDADVVVVNSCSVTAQADRKCRQAIAKAHHAAPSAMIVVTGCYAQLRAEEISRLPGVGLVSGTGQKSQLPERVLQALGLGRPESPGMVETLQVASPETAPVMPDVIPSAETTPCAQGPILSPDIHLPFEGAYSLHDRSRSFLKIQDGCDYRCAYCTVPLARGNSRNAPVESIVAAARQIAASGIREIVLTGVNIGDFGKTTGESLIDLLRRLDLVEGVERYRISSIEPDLLTDDIIAFTAAARTFMPHFHIPLQSGCDRTLVRMGRRYRRDIFVSRVEKIRQLMPDAFIAADVIVGFPGETDNDFEDTLALLRQTDLSACHVFPYSERPYTPAADMPDKVPFAEKERRSRVLLAWSERQKNAFYARFMGEIRRVFFESKAVDGLMTGFTDNYLRVASPFDAACIGRTAAVRLERVLRPGLLYGAPVPASDKN